MRPSRIVVGEVRQEVCLDLLIALNSGLPGMCTLHANSARLAIRTSGPPSETRLGTSSQPCGADRQPGQVMLTVNRSLGPTREEVAGATMGTRWGSVPRPQEDDPGAHDA